MKMVIKKTNVAETGDDNYSYLIGIFVLNFIFILALTNKKIRNRFFSLFLICSIVLTNINNVSAIDQNVGENQLEVSTSKSIIVDNDKYVINVKAIYNIQSNDTQKDYVPKSKEEIYVN